MNGILAKDSPDESKEYFAIGTSMQAQSFMVTSTLHAMLAFRNLVHSVSPHPLEISPAIRPSHSTVGEKWIPFCLENLTVETS